MWIVLVVLIILIIVGYDYNAGPYTVTIDAGKNNATFVISIIDDNIREQIETFNLTIDGSLLPNGVTSRANTTVAIIDNDSKWFVISHTVIIYRPAIATTYT